MSGNTFQEKLLKAYQDLSSYQNELMFRIKNRTT